MMSLSQPIKRVGPHAIYPNNMSCGVSNHVKPSNRLKQGQNLKNKS